MRTTRSRRRVKHFRFALETLEPRQMLDGAAADLLSAVATDDTFDRFESAEQLTEFVIADALKRYEHMFGREAWSPRLLPFERVVDDAFIVHTEFNASGDTDMIMPPAAIELTHSSTNVQVAGVDEADIVETDGEFIYLISDGVLSIVDVRTPDSMSVLSRSELSGHSDSMFLSGDRLTIISNKWRRFDIMPPFGRWFAPGPMDHDPPVFQVTVYDVTDRSSPEIVREIEIEGSFSDARAVDGTVYLVSRSDFRLPPPKINCTAIPHEPIPHEEIPTGNTIGILDWHDDVNTIGIPFDPFWPPHRDNCIYETSEEYLARIAGDALNLALPNYEAFDGENRLVNEGLLNSPEGIYQPLTDEHDSLYSITTIDVGGDDPGVTTSTAAPLGWADVVYATAENLYLSVNQWSGDGSTTAIYQFDLDNGDGITELVAAGSVRGHVPDQFALDEYAGVLRVVTQEGWRNGAVTRLFVLQKDGTSLNVIGSIDEIAPGEELFSTRFDGDRGFVVTFGPINGAWIDPLFTIDLSDPTTPTIQGELEIPGFSQYLHLIENNEFIIGLGRNADTRTGRWLEPQISLYDVTDFADPMLADRFSIDDRNGWSEALNNHHAVSYFDDAGILVIPFTTSGRGWRVDPFVDEIILRDDVLIGGGFLIGDGAVRPADNRLMWTNDWRPQAAFWVFRVDPHADADSDQIQLLGKVEHEGRVRRSLQIGDVLFTISDATIKATPIDDPAALIGEVYLFRSAHDDTFRVNSDSTDNELNVLRNDSLAPDTQGEPVITSVTAETDNGGRVAVNEDGRAVFYTPAPGFFGTDTFTYTINNGSRGVESAMVTVHVKLAVPEDSIDAPLDVLAGIDLHDFQSPGIESAEVDQGEVRVSDDRLSLLYTPPADFAGPVEVTFTVIDRDGDATLTSELQFVVADVNDDPTAQDDEFSFDKLLHEYRLPVLANDSWAPDHRYEHLRITDVTQPQGGEVEIADDGRVLRFRPSMPFEAPVEFTYTIEDGRGGTATANVFVEYVPLDDAHRMANLARLDLSRQTDIPPQRIDIVNIEAVDWPTSCLGIDVAGRVCATVITPGFRVALETAAAHYTYHTDTHDRVLLAERTRLPTQMEVRLEVVDERGNPIREIPADHPFHLNVYVHDARPNAEGIFAAYMDILYAAGVVEIGDDLETDRLIHEAFPHGHSLNVDTPGLLDEFGGFSHFEATGGEEVLFAQIPFIAKRPGKASFVATPADGDGREPLIFGLNDPIPPARIEFQGTSLTVRPGWRNHDRPSDVNYDGKTTANDALIVFNALNANGARQLAATATDAMTNLSADPAAAQYSVDVNGDSFMSALDAIQIINEINGVVPASPTAAVPQLPLSALVDWEAVDRDLRGQRLSAAIDALGISPSDAVKFVYEVLAQFEPREFDRPAAGQLRPLIADAVRRNIPSAEFLDSRQIAELHDIALSAIDHIPFEGLGRHIADGFDRDGFADLVHDELFAALGTARQP